VSIKDRLRRMEASFGGGRCPECGLRPQDKGYIVVDGKDPVPEMPEMCPECGRYTRIHIVVVYDDVEGQRADFIEVVDRGRG
jgi:hypothetical protein